MGLRAVPDRELRREIVLVTQQNFIFTGTVADNIALGRPGAGRDEIDAAARAIGAEAFISRLPGAHRTPPPARGAPVRAVSCDPLGGPNSPHSARAALWRVPSALGVPGSLRPLGSGWPGPVDAIFF